jgi:hypothetical protein
MNIKSDDKRLIKRNGGKIIYQNHEQNEIKFVLNEH